MSPHLTLLYGPSCNTCTFLALSYARFLDTLNTIFTFARTFEIEYDMSFSGARNCNITKDLLSSNFLQGASTMSCVRQIRIAKFL